MTYSSYEASRGFTSYEVLCELFVLHVRPQRAKKVVSDSPGLVDFAIGLVNSVFNLPDGQVMFLRNSSNRRTVKSILLVKKLLGLVKMTTGLVNANSASLKGKL